VSRVGVRIVTSTDAKVTCPYKPVNAPHGFHVRSNNGGESDVFWGNSVVPTVKTLESVSSDLLSHPTLRPKVYYDGELLQQPNVSTLSIIQF
jgi:hypothetical protein